MGIFLYTFAVKTIIVNNMVTALITFILKLIITVVFALLGVGVLMACTYILKEMFNTAKEWF